MVMAYVIYEEIKSDGKDTVVGVFLDKELASKYCSKHTTIHFYYWYEEIPLNPID